MSLCGVPGLHRSRDRPCHPGRRRPRTTRQHADHLHQRRQRRQCRRHGQRHAERVHHLQRHRSAGQGPVPLVRVLGLGADLPAFLGGLGLGARHAVQVDEAGAIAFRRDGAGRGHVVARSHQRPGRHSPPVPPRHRHRADDPRSDRHPGARYDRRHQAASRSKASSMAYTWDKANANAPTRHTTQYFEMLGNRAIYHDGWVACTTPVTLPWELSTKPPPDVITGYKWELYNVMEDPTAEQRPGRQRCRTSSSRCRTSFTSRRRSTTCCRSTTRRSRAGTRRSRASRRGGRPSRIPAALANVPGSTAPHILNKSYTITAEVTIPEGGAEGMIVTEGGRFGGYGLFLSKGEFGDSAAARWCSSTTCSTSSARSGRGLSSVPGSTPSSSTTSSTVRAWARAGRVCSPWTARRWPRNSMEHGHPDHVRRRRDLRHRTRTLAPASHC